MVKATALETCFYGGKRRRAGEEFQFNGPVKDLPKYLEQVKEPKKTEK